MRLERRTFLKGIGAAGAALTFTGYATADNGSAQYLVVANGNGITKQLEQDGFDVKQELTGGVSVVHGPEDAATDLERVGGVEAAVRDVQWTLEQPKEEVSEDEIEQPTLYEEFLWDKQITESLEANQTATGEGASIAVIDTGCDYEHPDLAPNLQADAGRLFKEGEIESGTAEDIVVGRPAPEGTDWLFDIDTVEQHVADDVEGHGTHVGGIAAAAADLGATGTGVLGTAPDADLVSYRVFWWIEVDEEADRPDERWAPTTTTGDILTAIDTAAEEGYDAVNLSLGTAPLQPSEIRPDGMRELVLPYRRVVRSAVQRGTTVVGSAGNDSTNHSRRGIFSLPNSVEGAISVSATAPNDELAFYSDFGTSEIDVGAPGGGYETLEKTLAEEGTEWPFPTNLVFSTVSPRVEDAAYGWKAGTSMAAPQVSGLVSLLRDLDPNATVNQIESAIKQGAEKGTGRSDPELGAGRINALNTVELMEDSDSGGRNGQQNRG